MSRTFDILHSENLRAAKLRPAPAPRPPMRAPSAAHDIKAGVESEILNLVQRVFILHAGPQAPKVVAFCGIDEGAGCSWVCARAGEALAAQPPGRVCVVDANLRSPSLHDQFRVENLEGFLDAMRDGRPVDGFVRPTWSERLWVMTAGAASSDPHGALNPAKLKSRITELRDEFDYLLIDTPAMSLHADAALLGRIADGVILVIGSASTRREPARIAKESLESAGVPVLGAVLNRRTYPIPEAIYQRL